MYKINRNKKSCLNKNLCSAISSANKPLNYEILRVKSFLEKYIRKEFPAVTTLRKDNVHKIYVETLNKSRNAVIKKNLGSNN